MQSVSNRRQQGHHICISHRRLTEASHIGISHMCHTCSTVGGRAGGGDDRDAARIATT
jgi:hypothetical protein